MVEEVITEAPPSSLNSLVVILLKGSQTCVIHTCNFTELGLCYLVLLKFFLLVYWLQWVFTAASGGYSLVAVLELLIAEEHGLQGAWVHQLWLMGTRAPSQ